MTCTSCHDGCGCRKAKDAEEIKRLKERIEDAEHIIGSVIDSTSEASNDINSRFNEYVEKWNWDGGQT